MTPEEEAFHEQALEEAGVPELLPSFGEPREETRPAEWRRIVLLEARVEALEASAQNLRAALRCQQEASEGLAHLYELLTVKVRTLEGLLLVALEAIRYGGPGPGTEVADAVELLREGIGREP